MIITRGYGIVPDGGGGYEPCETVVLADGLGVCIDNSRHIACLSSDVIQVSLYDDRTCVTVNDERIQADINNYNVEVDMIPDSYIIDVRCGSTLIPKEELMQKIAGENIGGFRVVTVDSNGHIVHATVQRILDGKATIGISTEAELAGNLCDIGVTGDEIIEPTWNWDINESLYLGIDGVLTQIPPTENFLQIVAVPLSPTSIRVRIEPPVFF